MDKLDRLQQLHRIFKSHRRPVAITKIAERLDCTEKNAKRLIAELRDRFFAPLDYCSANKGWFYDQAQDDPYELPGLWLTSQEIEGFSVILNLLQSLKADAFSLSLKPIENHINKLLVARGIDPSTFHQHIKLIHRGDLNANFDALVRSADAINQNQCLDIWYQSYSGKKTQRTISPLTLVHYSDNWYLDAWCHMREEFRSFQLPRIEKIKILKQKRKKVDEDKQQEHFSSAYGIFAGKARHQAHIVFSPAVAREVAAKEWHPDQKLQWCGGEVEVTIPYSDDRELIRDILKYGNDAEVLKPAALRNKIRNILRGMWQVYG